MEGIENSLCDSNNNNKICKLQKYPRLCIICKYTEDMSTLKGKKRDGVILPLRKGRLRNTGMVIHSPDSQYPFFFTVCPFIIIANQYIGNFDPLWAFPNHIHKASLFFFIVLFCFFFLLVQCNSPQYFLSSVYMNLASELIFDSSGRIGNNMKFYISSYAI